MENTEKSAAGLLNQTENEGRKLTKWELCRIVKELRKFRRFNRALEVRIMCLFKCLFEVLDFVCVFVFI